MASLANHGLVWADCEALERRHNLGRGTLVVLDVVPETGAPSYEERRTMLEAILPIDAVFQWRHVAPDAVRCVGVDADDTGGLTEVRR